MKQAVAIDPAYGEVWANLADVYCLASTYNAVKSSEARPLAQAAAQRAIALDPTLAKAHAAYASALSTDLHRWRSAEALFKRAADQLPEDHAAAPKNSRDLAEYVIAVADAVQHQLGTGCQKLSPRATIQALGTPDGDLDLHPYYAVVSKSGPQPKYSAQEITIATMQNRPKFTTSKMHQTSLDICTQLRAANPNLRNLVQRRHHAFNALTGRLPANFRP